MPVDPIIHEEGQLLFTDDDIREMVELGESIRGIRSQLIAEGKLSDKMKTRP